MHLANDAAPKVNRVVILGGGTAGFLCGLALRKHVPALDVVVVRSTKMGVIGVGEGTIVSVVQFLHNFLEFDPQAFNAAVEPSIKLGIRYLWGERPFFNYTFTPQLSHRRPELSLPTGYYCADDFDFTDMTSALMCHDKACLRRPNGEPALGSFAYHLENRNFVGYLEQMARERDLATVDDVVVGVEQDEDGVTALRLESGTRLEGDFFIDCSGFRSELLGKTLGAERVDFSKVLLCDKAVVGGWARTDEPYRPYTTAETMEAGWAWRIEHDDVINRGYVFSSDFLSPDDAEREFRAKNPNVGETRIVPFPAGVHRQTWVKNVIALGNAAGFVEPLEATAIGMICDGILNVVRVFESSGGTPMPSQRRHYNEMIYRNWTIIRDFLALHYKYNTRVASPFWRAAQHDVSVGDLAELCVYYEDVGPDFSLLATEMKRDFFGAEGYLAMLVGQRAPYRRTVEIPDLERTAWAAKKKDMWLRARDGMSVQECCNILRRRGLPRQMTGAGELGWSSKAG